VTLASDGVGSGAEVTIRLPLLTGVLDVPVAPSAEPVPDMTGVRLLLVDDAPDTREAVRMLLEDLGAEVHVARDGVEALDLAKSTDLDVVLCDLRMPRMDGYEFIQELRRGPELGPAVIAMSGFASSADHLRTEAAGFDGHVDKPFDEHRLSAAIEAARARRRSHPGAAPRPS
jgi:CheY-like chemotaxis protein